MASPAAAPARGSPADGARPVVPILALTTLGALLILGLGLVPSRAVPPSRVSAVLEEHHGQVTLLGGIALVGVFVALTVLAK